MAMLRQQLGKFNRLMQGIENFYEIYAKSVGLTYMSLTVLEILYHAEGLYTQKDICKMSHYNKQAVSVIVKGFHEKGYVEFQKMENDRRNKYVLFTECGKKYADGIMGPLSQMEEKALSVLSDAERRMLLEMLERCHDRFQQLNVNEK